MRDPSPAGARGVRRIREMKNSLDNSSHGTRLKIMFGVSILICAWVQSLEGLTTSGYTPTVTSYYERHSMMSTISIATSIIGSVCRPIIAKVSDLTLRPYTYIVVLGFYVLGYIIVASSTNITAYVVGEVFTSIGQAGITMLNAILIGDLTSLKWRGLGNALLSLPTLINPWFAGLIVRRMISRWRWGFGMWAIIMPVAIVPAIIVMLYYDHVAQRELIKERGQPEKKEWVKLIKNGLIEADIFGLLLMGFGWSLLLLPFSLYRTAENGWRNPSMIAMLIVGGSLLIAYVVYNAKWAKYPSMPLRIIKNRTFVCSVLLDFFYFCVLRIGHVYFSSYVWVVQDWESQYWSYYNSSLNMSVALFSLIAGVLMRVTHRFKYLQICALAIKIIGHGVRINGNEGVTSLGPLIATQILLGAGGVSVMASRVAAEASVHHDDLSQVIALLYLWNGIGSAVGSSIVASIWNNQLPGLLRTYLPESVSDAQVTVLFRSINEIRKHPMNSEIRQGAIQAYAKIGYKMFTVALGLAFIPLIISLFQRNFYLGDKQNAAQEREEAADMEKATSWKGRLAALVR